MTLLMKTHVLCKTFHLQPVHIHQNICRQIGSLPLFSRMFHYNLLYFFCRKDALQRNVHCLLVCYSFQRKCNSQIKHCIPYFNYGINQFLLHSANVLPISLYNKFENYLTIGWSFNMNVNPIKFILAWDSQWRQWFPILRSILITLYSLIMK